MFREIIDQSSISEINQKAVVVNKIGFKYSLKLSKVVLCKSRFNLSYEAVTLNFSLARWAAGA